MARYIDADLLKEQMKKAVYEYWNFSSGGYYLAEDAIQDIDNAPTADVVPRSTIQEIFALIWDAFQSTYYDSEFEEKFDKIEEKYIGE